MAPKKHGKATPKAAVKKAAAKKAMAKKATTKASPKRPSKPAVAAVKLEPGAAEESEDASASGLGLERGLISSLLTSLKYQVSAKKNSPQQKHDAQATLERYMTGDLDTKREILRQLQVTGPKACSWVHNLTTSTESTEASSETTMSNMLTQRPAERFCFLTHVFSRFVIICSLIIPAPRQAIFKIEGVDTTGMEPSDVKDLLEEVLRVSREKFKYDDHRETNEKFPQLSKYLFKWTMGNASVTGEETKTKVDSQGNMKKLANAIEAGPSTGAVDNGTAEYQECLSLQNELKQVRAKLARGAEELKQYEATLARRAKTDSVWETKVDEVKEKVGLTDGCLAKVRDLLSLTPAANDKNEEALVDLKAGLSEAVAHEKATRAVCRALKTLLGE